MWGGRARFNHATPPTLDRALNDYNDLLMGQFALGLRSLFIKAAIFVVMAALLAWALGGTLWPRPTTVNLATDQVTFHGHTWHWRLMAHEQAVDGMLKWRLVKSGAPDDAQPFGDRTWRDKAGPVLVNDSLYVGGRLQWTADGDWQIVALNKAGQVAEFPMPDRLAVEQQLERLKAGLPLQDRQTILRQRQQVLDPQ